MAWWQVGLLIGFLVALGLNVWATVRGHKVVASVTKPLLTVVLLVFYVLAAGRVQAPVVVALAAGLAGDLLLMLPEKGPWFALGLLAFLGGHLAYLVAFLVPGGLEGWTPGLIVPAVAYLVVGASLYAKLSPSLGEARPFVVAYMLVIVAMGIASLTALRSPVGWASALPVAGAALFVVSDSLIAFAKFGGAKPREGAVMATYGLAQLLLTLYFTLR